MDTLIAEMNKTAVAVVEQDSSEHEKLHVDLVASIYNAVSTHFASMGRDVDDEEFIENVTEVANDAASRLYRFRKVGE